MAGFLLPLLGFGAAYAGLDIWEGSEEKKLHKALLKKQRKEARGGHDAMAILALQESLKGMFDRASGTTSTERAIRTGHVPRNPGFPSATDEMMPGDVMRSILAADLGPEYAERIAVAATSQLPSVLRGYR